jgi:protein-tyrosine phosphatase
VGRCGLVRESAPVLEPDVYWVREVEGVRLAIMPRPRNGEWLADEVSGWKRMGIDTVVSLLEAHEVTDLGLAEERILCEATGVTFLSFPIADRGVPSNPAGFAVLVDMLVGRLRVGGAVAIHCRAGIGRSGLLGGCVLRRMGVETREALAMLSRARGVTVPDTDEQAEWVRGFGGEPLTNGQRH